MSPVPPTEGHCDRGTAPGGSYQKPALSGRYGSDIHRGAHRQVEDGHGERDCRDKGFLPILPFARQGLVSVESLYTGPCDQAGQVLPILQRYLVPGSGRCLSRDKPPSPCSL